MPDSPPDYLDRTLEQPAAGKSSDETSGAVAPEPTPLQIAETQATVPRAASSKDGPYLPLVPGYEVLSELGRGGMGVVYKARHVGLNRIVALKMILSGAHAGEHEQARFLAEAQAIAQVQHPNIVQIFEVSRHDGMPYFAL